MKIHVKESLYYVCVGRSYEINLIICFEADLVRKSPSFAFEKGKERA